MTGPAIAPERFTIPRTRATESNAASAEPSGARTHSPVIFLGVQPRLRNREQNRVTRVVTPTVRPRPAAATTPTGMRDSWLRKGTPRGPWTWAELKRQFRAFLPTVKAKTLCATLQQWGASPEHLEPLLRLVRDITLSNAVRRARLTRATWAAGTARDPYHKLTPEEPGALRPLLELVERVIAELEQLIQWQFTPPIVLHEQDAKHEPTQRMARLARLDEGVRAAFDRARTELLGVREMLRQDTQRPRGRKATLVQPYPVSTRSRTSAIPKAARRRDLVRMVRAEILALHPEQTTRPRAARVQAERLARAIIAAIPVLG